MADIKLLLPQDPFTQSLLSDLVANAVGAMLTSGVGLIRRDRKAPSKRHASIQEIVGISLAKVAKAAALPKLSGDAWKLFLTSGEAESVVRQLFALSAGGLWDRREEAWALFRRAAEQRLGRSYDERIARDSFDRIGAVVAAAVSELAGGGSTVGQEASALYRHGLVMSEIRGLSARLSTINLKPGGEVVVAGEMLAKLRAQVQLKHKFITPPNFDGAARIPIADLYVAPNVEWVATRRADSPKPIDLHRFLRHGFRNVAVGNPGGGKSTLVSRICWELTKEPAERIFGNRLLVPVAVILRDYGTVRTSEGVSLLRFLQRTLRTSYQLDCSTDSIEHWLYTGQLLVLFDGLDELLDTSLRQQVRDDVEQFANIYPSVPILVTSREVGYEFAPLNEEVFKACRLLPLTDEQVLDYAKKWFALDKDAPSEGAAATANAFFRESQGIHDLRSNPLMLGLLCNIYRGESYLPKNRPDVYEKCATMLFERWDKSRGIVSALPFDAHIGRTMKYLAHWIYLNPELQSGVTEARLVNECKVYLETWRFEDSDVAMKAAKEFIEFCRGRAWVFTDTGTTAGGDRLYQFTHRTFLEYFAAAYVVRTNPEPQKLAALLLERVKSGEWEMVAQLAFQLQAKTIEGAGEELFSRLGAEMRTDSPSQGQLALSLFGLRCMSFIVCRPSATKALTADIIESLVDIGVATSTRELVPISELVAACNLMDQVAIENVQVFADAAVERLMSVVSGVDVERSRAAILLTELMRLVGSGPVEQSVRGIVGRRVAEGSAAEFRSAAEGDYAMSAIWARDNAERIGLALRWHGAKAIFCEPVLFSNASLMSLAHRLLRNGMDFGRAPHAAMLAELAEVGGWMNKQSPPWIRRQDLARDGDWGFSVHRTSKGNHDLPRVQGDVCFGLLGLAAVTAELSRGDQAKLESAGDLLAELMISRRDGAPCPRLLRHLEEAALKKAQRELVENWCRGLVTLVQES